MAPRTTRSAAAKPAKSAVKAKPAGAVKVAAKPPSKPVKSAPSAKTNAKTGAVAFKLKDLVEAVAASTGGKRPDVKKTVEATLSALADALKRGADLAVPPLGRARVAKATGKDGAAVMTLKLRLAEAGKGGSKQALADDGEDS